MNTSRRQMLLALTALALAGCAGSPKPSLYRLQAPNVELRNYRTFAFYPMQPSGGSPIVHQWLLEAARGELERRGYAFDPRQPDLLVNIGAVIEERQALRGTPGGPYAGWGRLEAEDYLQGLLSVDLVDARRRELVWQGVAKGRVGDAMLRDVAGTATRAMAEIFQGFPTQAGGTRPAARDGGEGV